jgi:hypothetical protein
MVKPINNRNDAAKDAAEASVLAAASNLGGGMDAARQWYFHQAITELDGLTSITSDCCRPLRRC